MKNGLKYPKWPLRRSLNVLYIYLFILIFISTKKTLIDEKEEKCIKLEKIKNDLDTKVRRQLAFKWNH